MQNGLTIGIPVYNEEALIERTIRSAAPQCGRLLVADNGSTDGTSAICKRLLSEFPNMEYVCHAENIGARENWMYILNDIHTPYLMFLGSHDHIDQGYVKKVLPLLENDETLEGAMGQLCFEQGEDTRPVPSFNAWMRGTSDSAKERVWEFLFDQAPLTWLTYGIYRTASFKDNYTDELPAYGIDAIFLAKILGLGRIMISPERTFYHAWIREKKDNKADYLERIIANKPASKRSLDMQNDFRLAKFEIIKGLFPDVSFWKLIILRLQSMSRFGIFRKQGLDPLFYILYIPSKIIRKIARISRWTTAKT